MVRVVLDISHILHASYDGKHDNFMKQGFSLEDLRQHVRSDVILRMYDYCKSFRIPLHELIVAMDSKSWRYDIFPEYKANRRNKMSNIDPDEQKEFFNTFTRDIEEIFPFQVLRVQGSEADDIIGTLALNWDSKHKLVIISRDHDFLQLIREDIFLWNPLKGDFIRSHEIKKAGKKIPAVVWDIKNRIQARDFLLFHIFLGDIGDGIPNILCPNDLYVNPLIKGSDFGKFGPATILKNFFSDDIKHNNENIRKFHHKYKKNLDRNSKLVDLRATPKKIQEKILDKFNNFKFDNNYNVDKIKEWCNEYELYDVKEIFSFYEF